MKKDIFTINVFDIESEEEVTPMNVSVPFYDIDEAIERAKTVAVWLMLEKNVVEARVMGGEYENEKGEIWGESEVFYTASNSTKEHTKEVRQKMGYCSLEVDFYAQ